MLVAGRCWLRTIRSSVPILHSHSQSRSKSKQRARISERRRNKRHPLDGLGYAVDAPTRPTASEDLLSFEKSSDLPVAGQSHPPTPTELCQQRPTSPHSRSAQLPVSDSFNSKQSSQIVPADVCDVNGDAVSRNSPSGISSVRVLAETSAISTSRTRADDREVSEVLCGEGSDSDAGFETSDLESGQSRSRSWKSLGDPDDDDDDSDFSLSDMKGNLEDSENDADLPTLSQSALPAQAVGCGPKPDAAVLKVVGRRGRRDGFIVSLHSDGGIMLWYVKTYSP